MTIHLNRNFPIFFLSRTGDLRTSVNSPSQTMVRRRFPPPLHEQAYDCSQIQSVGRSRQHGDKPIIGGALCCMVLLYHSGTTVALDTGRIMYSKIKTPSTERLRYERGQRSHNMNPCFIPFLSVNRWLVGKGVALALLAVLALDGGLCVTNAFAQEIGGLAPNLTFSGMVGGTNPATQTFALTRTKSGPKSSRSMVELSRHPLQPLTSSSRRMRSACPRPSTLRT